MSLWDRTVPERDGVDVVHDHTLDADLHRYYRELGDGVHLVAISDRQRALAPDLNWIGTVHDALRLADWPVRREKEDYALFLGRSHPDNAPHLALDATHAAGLPLVLAGTGAEPVEKEYLEQEVRPRLTERDHVFGVAEATKKRRLLGAGYLETTKGSLATPQRDYAARDQVYEDTMAPGDRA